ncbi:TPA: hypothetical protein I7740_12810 [Vibrio vulnificus]|nr:hypothetical protein FORC9_4306 [Vibrio vulnificus]ANH66187.1 hypothetical protein FORC16_4304 [Vibrio vulnificus]HAS8441571.1 hypothetical protein [Vibrio vulnificus]
MVNPTLNNDRHESDVDLASIKNTTQQAELQMAIPSINSFNFCLICSVVILSFLLTDDNLLNC